MRRALMSISKNTWEHMSADQREWLLFDTLQTIDIRLCSLERKKTADKVFAFLANTVGSFSAVALIVWAKVKLF